MLNTKNNDQMFKNKRDSPIHATMKIHKGVYIKQKDSLRNIPFYVYCALQIHSARQLICL